LPINRVKIDQSFIRELHRMKERTMVQHLISLCKELSVEVVAEGVETLEQAAILSAMGCNLMQGYMFGKAVDANRFGNESFKPFGLTSENWPSTRPSSLSR